MVHQTKHMTVQQFEKYIQQPENADRLFELVNGEIVEKVPTEEHGMIVLNIAAPIRAFARHHKLGRVTTEAIHRLPDDDQNAVLPAVSFRSDPATPVVRRGSVPVMPDLAVEVQSPSQSDEDLIEKAAYYLANGSRMVWLVFPAKRTEAAHQHNKVEALTEADTLDGGDVLPGFKLAVSEIFALD